MKGYILTLLLVLQFVTFCSSSTEKTLSAINPRGLLTEGTHASHYDKTKSGSFKNRLEFYQLVHNELANMRHDRKSKKNASQLKSSTASNQEEESLWLKFFGSLRNNNDNRFRF